MKKRDGRTETPRASEDDALAPPVGCPEDGADEGRREV